MGKLQQIKEDKPELFKTNNTGEKGATVQNIPLRLEGFEDDKYFVGTNLETKEKIKVYLRDIEQKSASKQKRRKEIDDFRDPNDKNLLAEINKSVFLFESCYPDKESGVYSSRWANLISRTPEETKVVIAHCSLVFTKKKGEGNEGEENIFLRTIHPERCRQVGDVDTLEEELTKMLTPQSQGSNPFVYIRITDDEGDVEIVPAMAKRIDRDDGLGKEAASGAESTEAFLTSDKSEIVKMLISDPDVKVELFPARVIFPGTATKDKMLDSHENAKKVLKESFYIKVSEEDGGEKPTYPELGFLKCCLAIRSHADGTPFFTHVKPLRPFEAATSVKEIEDHNNGV